MPRKLPWGKGSSAPSALPRPTSGIPNHTPKRQRLEKVDPGSDTDDGPRQELRPPSTSPPPGPPPESFMNEGMEHDDKYRMVEDEFFSVAQRFTVHLHAAEYKRQEKLAKARNAEAITSISRPVTGKMSDQTSRKLASANRSKTQKGLLEGFASDDSDDDDNLPYVGTSLHGLMDSPRKITSLLKVGSIGATTRAAAGFNKPAASRNLPAQATSRLPGFPSASHSSKLSKFRGHSPTITSNDDDDLDAPILAPKLGSPATKPTFKRRTLSDAPPIASPSRNVPGIKVEPIPASISSIKSFHSTASATRLVKVETNNTTISGSSNSKLSRLDHARRQKVKQELDQQKNKKLDEIPTFL
ncbi:uncharacterized protein BP5553_10129 [Venustampulla echinocandica]|uniref:Uncharacterized protein n=1 Tax=Venustampulla echinocandica TaxID=2656787 RepID=A0A370TAE2_9HELO|nr:uncharacterized protein BP5553_10129 [Venustampulla echinocandica]RDL30784.1 hypothetical protein BP5553_10129 [Venustampulla echinocandica]